MAILLVSGVLFVRSQSQLQAGYAMVTADAGTSLPVGTALFSYTNASGVLVSQAGVGAVEPVTSGRIIVDEAGTQTGIAIVNPSLQRATVNQRIRRIDALTRIITSVAGTGTAGFSADNVPASGAQLSYPSGVARMRHAIS